MKKHLIISLIKTKNVLEFADFINWHLRNVKFLNDCQYSFILYCISSVEPNTKHPLNNNNGEQLLRIIYSYAIYTSNQIEVLIADMLTDQQPIMIHMEAAQIQKNIYNAFLTNWLYFSKKNSSLWNFENQQLVYMHRHII